VEAAQASVQEQLDGLVATVTRVEQSAAKDESERLDDLAERLDQLAGVLGATTAATTGREGDVVALRARIDEAYAKASGVISELQLSLGALLSRVGALEALPEQPEPPTELLDDLAARLGLVERGGEAVDHQIGKVLDTWASDRSSLEARFEEVERQLTRTDELDDLARRLDAVEHGAHGVFAAADGPVAGHGRFRLELRALELRLEQAEIAALEGHNVVLAQLERIASRIEPRPQRRNVHDEGSAHEDPTPAGAEIVPFRGAEV
jgi:small-conductance mechanosensitive channel